MKKIQEELKKQYNTSIGFYNKGDYEHYFFHTRKSIELIGKFLILVDYTFVLNLDKVDSVKH